MSLVRVHPIPDLGSLAEQVRHHHAQARAASERAVEHHLAIGRCLREARELLPSDQAYGQWFRAQGFGFSQQWGWTLRTAAENEAEVRATVTSQLVTGRFNLEAAVIEARNRATTRRPALHILSGQDGDGDPDTARYSTLVADPPWPYANVATRGAAENHYPAMAVEEICGLPVSDWAKPDSHLYLWVTNGFLREAFVVMEAWGWTYRTTLVWAKPQMGLGNYFRVGTEHVLFGTRGELPTRSRSLVNWFEAPRTRHSVKPEAFYTLVEQASPDPYLEMFARKARPGWDRWGNEA